MILNNSVYLEQSKMTLLSISVGVLKSHLPKSTSNLFIVFLMYIRICLSVYLYIKCMHKAHGSQTRVLDSLELHYR